MIALWWLLRGCIMEATEWFSKLCLLSVHSNLNYQAVFIFKLSHSSSFHLLIHHREIFTSITSGTGYYSRPSSFSFFQWLEYSCLPSINIWIIFNEVFHKTCSSALGLSGQKGYCCCLHPCVRVTPSCLPLKS